MTLSQLPKRPDTSPNSKSLRLISFKLLKGTNISCMLMVHPSQNVYPLQLPTPGSSNVECILVCKKNRVVPIHCKLKGWIFQSISAIRDWHAFNQPRTALHKGCPRLSKSRWYMTPSVVAVKWSQYESSIIYDMTSRSDSWLFVHFWLLILIVVFFSQGNYRITEATSFNLFTLRMPGVTSPFQSVKSYGCPTAIHSVC